MNDKPKKRTAIAGLVISASLLVGTAVHEGYTTTAIRPLPGDSLTIGFGNTKGVSATSSTTPIRALITLANDLDGRKRVLANCIHTPLTQNELDAYMDLAYNIGTGAFCHSSIVSLLNKKNYSEACQHILAFDMYHGKHNKGLHIRRLEEYDKCTQ